MIITKKENHRLDRRLRSHPWAFLAATREGRLLVVQQVVVDDEVLPLLPLVQAVVVDSDDVELELLFARVVCWPELHVRQQLRSRQEKRRESQERKERHPQCSKRSAGSHSGTKETVVRAAAEEMQRFVQEVPEMIYKYRMLY